MSRGARAKRYNEDRKLNVKKVIAVIIAFLVIIMFVIGTKELVKNKPKTNEKAFPLAYFPIYEQEKWGVMDTKGNIVISPSYEEMIIIPDNTKPVFLCMTDVDYSANTYSTKAINEKNEPIFTDYEKVEALYNNDENNNLWYESNVLKVQKNGKYGLINFDGKDLTECTYDSIEVIPGTKSAYVTTLNGKKGVIDNIGKVIIENKYSEITSLTNKFENGFIVKNEQGKFGVINYDKTEATAIKYDDIKHVYGNSMYVVKEGTIWRIVNAKGENFLDNSFEDVKEIDKDNVVIKRNGKYGVINLKAEEKIPVIYDELSYAFSNYYIAKKDNTYGIITETNETVLDFNYTYITYLSNAGIIQAETNNSESELLDKELNVKASGIIAEINQEKNYIRIRKNDKYIYYNFKLEEKENTEILATNTIFLSKKNGKYGYVNEKGEIVVDHMYEDATEQNKYGYVAVKLNGKWGSIDSKGKVVQLCKYSLENSMLVDFIAEWHLASDVNANYYTK